MTAQPNQRTSAARRGVWHLLQAMHTHGKCVDTTTPHKWFPLDRLTPGESDQYAAWACDGCPVRDECLTYAIETRQQHGVWGAWPSTGFAHWARAPAGCLKLAGMVTQPPALLRVRRRYCPVAQCKTRCRWTSGRMTQPES